MKNRAAAKGRRLSLLAAVCVLASLLVVPAAQASRSLPAALAPVLEAPVAPAQALEEKPAEPQTRYRLFGDLTLPERPLELVQIQKTASGVSTSEMRLNIWQTGGLRQKCGSPSFQGLWTDPVTGIAYARNRWYDARTASWLSEDPLGAVDSPNLYAFVGWGPQAGRDPMGLGNELVDPGGNDLLIAQLGPGDTQENLDALEAQQRVREQYAVGFAERLWHYVTAPFRIPAAIRKDNEAYRERIRALDEGGYQAYRQVLKAQSAETGEQLASMIPGRNTYIEVKQLPQTYAQHGPEAAARQLGGATASGAVDAMIVVGTTRALVAEYTAPNPVVVRAEAAAARPTVRYNRQQHYGGSQTTNPVAQELRVANEGVPCPLCGEPQISGTPHAPSPQHSPMLWEHYNKRGGHLLTDAERRAYAASGTAFDGTICLRCQRVEGAEAARLSRELAKRLELKRD